MTWPRRIEGNHPFMFEEGEAFKFKKFKSWELHGEKNPKNWAWRSFGWNGQTVYDVAQDEREGTCVSCNQSFIRSQHSSMYNQLNWMTYSWSTCKQKVSLDFLLFLVVFLILVTDKWQIRNKFGVMSNRQTQVRSEVVEVLRGKKGKKGVKVHQIWRKQQKHHQVCFHSPQSFLQFALISDSLVACAMYRKFSFIKVRWGVLFKMSEQSNLDGHEILAKIDRGF